MQKTNEYTKTYSFMPWEGGEKVSESLKTMESAVFRQKIPKGELVEKPVETVNNRVYNSEKTDVCNKM